MSEDLAKDTSKKAYAVAMILALVALIIFAKIIALQAMPDEQVLKLGESKAYRVEEIAPTRGQIYSSDGSLLATSVPIYEIRWDSKAKFESKEFKEKLDSLCDGLQKILGDKTKAEYKKALLNAKANNERYFKLAENIDYNQLQAIKKLPFIKNGRYKSGFFYPQKSKRKKPFGSLAARTIGLNREDNQVGLELAYDNILSGKKGKQLQEKMAGGEWRPMNDEFIEQPEPGNDIVATVDVHLQDVAHNALLRQLQESQADWGCAVVMEVETGFVRAIANLTLNPSTGAYDELLNIAIAQSVEPGSTFKLPSIMAMLDEGAIQLGDSVATGSGSLNLGDQILTDSNIETGGNGTITAEQVFEKSSNVGTALLAKRSFDKNPQKFLEKLNGFGLGNSLNLEIAGEPKPKLYTSTKNKGWSGLSLTQIAIGYETQFTPLQILAFYNAVANNGKLVKPLFVEEIKKNGRTIERKQAHVLNDQICKRETLAKCRKMMEGVMEPGGTADKTFNNSPYKVAGKTGTARVNENGGYQDKAYRASFVGYFPADQPKYSCIVVIHRPKGGKYYGSAVAAPVFKELADKIYATRLEFHENSFKPDSLALANAVVPISKDGLSKDLTTVYKALQIKTSGSASEYASTKSEHGQVLIQDKSIVAGSVPNVIGMGLRDALFLLEKEGLKVQIIGAGTVKKQSVLPGTSTKSNKYITLELS